MTSYKSKLCGFMKAIEIANQKNWKNIWIESDSALLVLASKNSSKIPWDLRNRWLNVMAMCRGMNCMVTHIYREGNQVADSLANYALSLTDVMFWQTIPSFIRVSCSKDQLGWSNFRICT
jgi:ribonuclease HI